MLYNVANEDNLIGIRDLAETMVTLLPDRTCKVRFAPEAAKLQYLPFKLAILDTSKVRDLGWKPIIDTKTMFEWTMESFL